MASMIPTEQYRRGTDRVRHELLIALHFGKLSPGDQVPSVRRLADRTGMNRKTIHRAYRRLAEEGLLDVRPGSGTFVAEPIPEANGSASIGDLLLAVHHCRATGDELGLSPARLASFLSMFLGNGLRGMRVTVAECNLEQLGLISTELADTLGLDIRPVLLANLTADPARAMRDRDAIVTTDCHRSEVESLVSPLKLPVYRVALDPRFPRQISDRARLGPVVMVVRDCGFVPVFKRLLGQMSIPQEVIDRCWIVEPRELGAVLAEAPPETVVCVSPVAGNLPPGRIPDRFRRLHSHWRIEPGSLDRLRASMSMDLVSREGHSDNSMPS